MIDDDQQQEPEDGEYEDKERRGSHMTEIESYERLIEGLKMAADAAHHLAAHRHRERWEAASDIFDNVRQIVVAMAAKEGKYNDGVINPRAKLYLPMGFSEAFERLQDGLRQSCGAVRQLAVYHRADLRWLQVERYLLDLRAKASKLGRMTSGLQPRLVN
jgi:hypothetical protein